MYNYINVILPKISYSSSSLPVDTVPTTYRLLRKQKRLIIVNMLTENIMIYS